MDCLTHLPPKSNTRIPPIILARQTTKNKNKDTGTNTNSQRPQFSHLAILSKQKLYREASTGDPDLRRCIGHHRLLRRTLQEAKDDMKRYLDDVLESNEDSDSDSGEEDDEQEQGDMPLNEYPQDKDTETVFPGGFPAAVAPAPMPTSTPPHTHTPTPTSVPGPAPVSTSDSPPAPTFVKEKIVGVVKGLVRRRNSTPSRIPAPVISSAKGSVVDIAKNVSCSDLPIRVHVHGRVAKDGDGLSGLDRSQSQGSGSGSGSELGSTQTKSLTVRGRQYAQRLGLKVAAAVPVAM
ncbi:hypothetical protein BDW62DRAFT_190149 [Aspergillus aurantiobrunneus]